MGISWGHLQDLNFSNLMVIYSKSVQKDPLTEKDLLDRLPSREITLNTMLVTHLLSLRATKPLGDFEVNYLYDPVCVDVIKR